MKIFISTALLFLIASSSSFAVAQSSICPKGTSPQCCADDVLGGADSDCNDPPRQPTDGADLGTICGDIGQKASCCIPPAFGQGGICSLVSDA